MSETGGERCGLSEIAPEPQHANARIAPLDLGEPLERLVHAAVVDEDNFVGAPRAAKHFGQLLMERPHVGRFVAHRNDDGYFGGHQARLD